MDINAAKSIVLATLFVVTFISCLLPLKLVNTIRNTQDPRRKTLYERVMSFLNCFAGGVFLGTCLLDLFPEVQDNVKQATELLDIPGSFPIAEFLVVVGFFLVLIVEQVSLDCKSQQSRSPDTDERESLLGENSSLTNNTPANYNSLSENHGHSHSINPSEMTSNSSLRSLLLLIALSLHSVFEGLAIGLQPNVDAVLQIFAAVALHKSVIAFGLSLNLVQSNLKVGAILKLTFIFCVAAPIGLGIGMGVMEVCSTNNTIILSGLLQGFACGTFLYVTFFEVLPHELNSSGQRMSKLFFIILGFTASCLIVFMDPDTSKPRS